MTPLLFGGAVQIGVPLLARRLIRLAAYSGWERHASLRQLMTSDHNVLRACHVVNGSLLAVALAAYKKPTDLMFGTYRPWGTDDLSDLRSGKPRKTSGRDNPFDDVRKYEMGVIK